MRLIIGITMLSVLLPKFALMCLSGLYRHKKISIFTRAYSGQNFERIEHRTITVANRALSDIDTWLLYIQGKVDLVGPRPMNFDAALRVDKETDQRHNVRPGIISPAQVKRTSGIAHVSENELANEFAKNASLLRRTQILVVWALQKLFSTRAQRLLYPPVFKLMDVTIDNLTMKSAVAKIVNGLSDSRKAATVKKYAFVNADCVNKYRSQPQYKNTLKLFDSVFADGIGIKLAARWQDLGVSENVNGTDMFPLLCCELEKQKKSIYLLGGSPSVVKKVASKLNREYPNLQVAGFCDGYQHKQNPAALHELINRSEADLLLVAMGAPQQEQWILDNQEHISVNAAIGVGGLFDFYSETVSRAPEWVRELSLEWIWRLAAQPLDKGKRYLIGNPLFLFNAAVAARKAKQKPISFKTSNVDRG